MDRCGSARYAAWRVRFRLHSSSLRSDRRAVVGSSLGPATNGCRRFAQALRPRVWVRLYSKARRRDTLGAFRASRFSRRDFSWLVAQQRLQAAGVEDVDCTVTSGAAHLAGAPASALGPVQVIEASSLTRYRMGRRRSSTDHSNSDEVRRSLPSFDWHTFNMYTLGRNAKSMP